MHADVLMTNPAHLLVSSDRTDGMGAMMKAIRPRYARWLNWTVIARTVCGEGNKAVETYATDDLYRENACWWAI